MSAGEGDGRGAGQAQSALDAERAIEAVWRIEAARLIGGLARMVGDVGLAEDMAQDALVLALERWPESGVPENPGAWLMATAKNRAIDELRRRRRLENKQEELAREIVASETETGARDGTAGLETELASVQEIEDDVLRLMCVTCHPVLSTEARVALTLRMLGGLTTREIARAHLVPDATMSQRIVRAKRTLAEARVPFELPGRDELGARIESVCEVVYLVFNEGYAASGGEEWIRPELCREALRLGRILAALTPRDPEVHGLLALMELQMSRFGARIGPAGEPVLLSDQNRARWDRLLASRGLAALERAQALARADGEAIGRYTLQAAIAACHARARTAAETNWERIAALYDALAQLQPSPVVELNRAVAVAMAFGPQAGLELVDALAAAPALRDYRLLPSVRGDLLARLGRREEAHAEFERAAALTHNARERRLLLDRAAACAWAPAPPERPPAP
ncbi:MAG TPA: RNA polymerase sigma factor [Solirubrobacteraceae bacterium]|nr:RNA polymerase sigma factor [Solirubrobacteraceae bacterium]